MSELAKLREQVAALKSAPIYNKAARAEQVMDALIAFLAHQQNEIEKLKGEQHGKR